MQAARVYEKRKKEGRLAIIGDGNQHGRVDWQGLNHTTCRYGSFARPRGGKGDGGITLLYLFSEKTVFNAVKNPS